jgi:AraC-like DNA-binding protein
MPAIVDGEQNRNGTATAAIVTRGGPYIPCMAERLDGERGNRGGKNPGVAIRSLFRSERLEVVTWRCSAAPSGSTAEMMRSWYVVSFTHSGTFVLHSRERAEIIDATRAMVIRPGEPFRMTRCNESTATGSAVAIRPDLFETMGGCDAAIARFGVPASAFLLQQLLVRNATGDAAAEIEEAAVWIASATLRAGVEQPRRPSTSAADTICDVQTLLAANINAPLRLGEIASAVKRSPYHLCRMFSRDTGLRMHRYLQRLRICASVSDVIDRRVSLSALAQALGYSSHSHFDGAFRDELRVTPAELRRISALPHLSQMRDALPS